MELTKLPSRQLVGPTRPQEQDASLSIAKTPRALNHLGTLHTAALFTIEIDLHDTESRSAASFSSPWFLAKAA